MPNWTYNHVNMKGIGKAKELYDNEGSFDFNTIIPMPEELKGTISGGVIDECIAYYLLKSRTKEKFFKDVDRTGCSPSYYRRSWTKTKIAELLLERIGDNPCMFESDFYDHDNLGNGRFKPHNHHHTPEEIGKFYWNLLEKYGYNDWYRWSCDNWDTKWNACDSYICDDDNIEFDTAWSAPESIFEKLSEMYPDLEVYTESHYEDGGCWIMKWLNGNKIYDSWED